jgi:transposase-like protein
MMKTEDIKLPADRRRGRYSNEFKRALVKACEAPGVSTASVALANGVNANLLRRWVSELRTPSALQDPSPKDDALSDKPAFVRIEADVRNITTPVSNIELVLQRGDIRVLVSGSGAECAEFVRVLFK